VRVAGEFGNLFLRLAQLALGQPRAPEQDAAEFGGFHPVRGAHQQHHAAFALQRQQILADGTLREVEPPRRPAHAARVRNGNEIPQMNLTHCLPFGNTSTDGASYQPSIKGVSSTPKRRHTHANA
jgi:hypothetical protein